MTKLAKLGNTKLNLSKLGIGGAAFKDHTDSTHVKEVVETALKNGKTVTVGNRSFSPVYLSLISYSAAWGSHEKSNSVLQGSITSTPHRGTRIARNYLVRS